MTQDGSEVSKGVLRLDGQAAIVVGGGQTPGQTIGNGRATAITYARAGARVLVADRDLDAAAATVAEITAEGGEAVPFLADVTDEADIAAMVADACDRWERLDISCTTMSAFRLPAAMPRSARSRVRLSTGSWPST